MKRFQLIKTLPEEEGCHLFHEVLAAVYPPDIITHKMSEGINNALLLGIYVLLDNQKPVARCCLYNNPELQLNGNSVICIGNYECVDDTLTSKTFFDEITKLASEFGARQILGPMNGSTWDAYRLGSYDCKEAFFMEPCYPVYYTQQFTNAGFEKTARYLSNIDRSENLLNERIQRVETTFNNKGISFRNISINNYENELEGLYKFCSEAFKNNLFYSSISFSDFSDKYRKIKTIINPNYVLIAEDKNKDMVGLIFCFENYNDKKEKGLIIKTLARKPALAYAGMGNVLVSRIKEKARNNGYTYIIHALMLESNVSKSLSRHFSGETFREYYLYNKVIQ